MDSPPRTTQHRWLAPLDNDRSIPA